MDTVQSGRIVCAGGEISSDAGRGRCGPRKEEGLITLDEVCRIFHRTKRQVYRYRLQGLPDYGGRPVMFDPVEVRQFVSARKKNKGADALSRKALEALEDDRIAKKLLAKFSQSRR